MSLSAPAGPEAEKDRTSPLLSKTCQNCFSLKIRCDRTQRQDICDRCARLGKQCVFRPARRRDNSAKRDSRIQALEAQVQNLLRTKPSSTVAQQPLPEVAAPAPAPHAPSSAAASDGGDVIDDDILTSERAEILVETYKADMMPHFPFVILAPHVTGERLRYEKPFLFVAVLTVASFHDLGTQEKLGARVKQLVVEKILFGGNDCLELQYLQGLLVALAWNNYVDRSSHYTQFLQLAISIAVDMRLDRKPIRKQPSNHNKKRDPLVAGSPGTQTWGPEEQRAAAGIFYLSSTISKLLDKMNTFPCTRFIEEGCLALGQRAEYKTDKDLYHVIRLHRIIERIETLASQSDSETDAHLAFLNMRDELDAFSVFLTADVSDSHFLYMQFHTAKLFLYQVAFFERGLQQSPALHLPMLCEGLESAKAFLDLYLWLPPKSEMALSNSEWIQLSFGVTQAAKFAIISKEPNVEPQTRELRRRLSIDHVFRHLSLRIGALVGRAGAGDKRKDIFYHYEQRVKKIQVWYERMIRATGSGSPPQQAPVHSSPSTGYGMPQPLPRSSSGPAAIPQIPLSANFTHHDPQMMPYGNAPLSVPPESMLQGSGATTGLTGMDPNSYAAYDVPMIAFPDLINAPGWDSLFDIPMEDTSWFANVPTQGYTEADLASQPSDPGSWNSGGV